MTSRYFYIFFIFYFFLFDVYGVECDAIFTDGIQTNHNGGRVTFNSGSQLINSPDNILDTKRITDNTSNNSCVTEACGDDNSIAATIDLDWGAGGSNQSFSSGNHSLLPGTYANVTLGWGAVVTFSSGDYYINGSLQVDGGELLVSLNSNSDPIRIFVTGTVGVNNASRLNFPEPEASSSARDVLIFAKDTIEFQSNSFTKAFIYSVEDINGNSGSTVEGATSGRNVTLQSGSTVTFEQTAPGFGDFCTGPSALLVYNCDIDTSSPVIFQDDFSTVNSWQAINFERPTNGSSGPPSGNWPNDNRFYQANSEEQDVIFDMDLSQLNIAGSAQTGGHNEYGMVGYDFSGYDTSNITSYSLSNTLVPNRGTSGDPGLNNDIGLVFSYQDQDNYYMARWAKYGSDYQNNNNFPGEYRRLEIVKVVAGDVTRLAGGTADDSYNLYNSMTMKVIVNEQGIVLCLRQTSDSNTEQVYLTSTERPPLHEMGFFSYDNDDGVVIDNVEVRCKNCPELIVGPIALYRFEHPDLTEITDTSGNNRHGINAGGESTAYGQYCRGFDSLAQNTNNSTDKAFDSTVDVINDIGLKGTVSFWFNSHTDWDLGGYGASGEGGKRTLFDASEDQNTGTWDENRYFHLGLGEAGQLRFAFKDSNNDRKVIEETIGAARSGDSWHYISATWDLTTNTFQLYVDGSIIQNQIISTSGALSNLGTIVFGDNASVYSNKNPDPNNLPSQYSANGKFDEVRIYNVVRTAAEIQADMDDRDCVTTIDHLEIIHEGDGITCAAEPVTINACIDADCSTLYQEPFSVDLLVNGVFDQTISGITGSVATTFNYGTPDTATLSLSETFECKNGGISNCEVLFSEAGFIFSSIPDQVAGVTFSGVSIQAVKNNSGVCETILTGAQTVGVALEYHTPDKATDNSFTVNSGDLVAKNRLGTSFNYSDINLTFLNDSSADLGVNNYDDAGEIKLHARLEYPAVGGEPGFTISGSSSSFWVAPDHFDVTVQNSSGTQLNATTSAASPIHAAGEAFSLVIHAKNASGSATTTNYIADQPQFKLIRTGPTVNGAEGTFTLGDTNTISNGTKTIDSVLAANSPIYRNRNIVFVDGIYTFDEAKYSEVGLINLTYRDANYGPPPQNSHPTGITDVGRFTPSYFVQEVEREGDLHAVHNSALASGASCQSGDTNVYTGEEDIATLGGASVKGAIQYLLSPRYQITAFNGDLDDDGVGQVTKNYTGEYRKLTDGKHDIAVDNDIAVVTPLSDAEQDGALTPVEKVSLTADVTTGSLTEVEESGVPVGGVMLYEFNEDDHFIYTRDENSKITPFQSQIELAASSIQDSDGVNVDFSNEDHFEAAVVKGVEVRFARLFIENSYGPETSNLPQDIFIDIFTDDSGTGEFTINPDDNCTLYNSTEVTLTDEGLAPSLPGVETAEGTLVNGKTRNIILTAPGAGNTGDIGVSYSAYDWLKYDWDGVTGVGGVVLFNDDPSATASFGFYRGNDRIIFRREVSN